MTEQIEASQHSHEASKNNRCRPLVVLVHGIRTSGKWIRRIKPVLEAEADCVVEPAGFGFFDVFRFLLPGSARRTVIETVKWKLLHAIELHKECPLIIIAHSFGTFCITEILKDSPQIHPVRLLFCGSIVAQNFRWDSLRQMAPERGMLVVNECGAQDIWPPLAHSMTFGYGYSGNRGFQTPGIDDRYHDLGHSGYFTKEFVRRFWVPFVRNGTIRQSDFEGDMRESPWWISAIGMRPVLPWLVWVVLLALSVTAIIGVGMASQNAQRRVDERPSENKREKLDLKHEPNSLSETEAPDASKDPIVKQLDEIRADSAETKKNIEKLFIK